MRSIKMMASAALPPGPFTDEIRSSGGPTRTGWLALDRGADSLVAQPRVPEAGDLYGTASMGRDRPRAAGRCSHRPTTDAHRGVVPVPLDRTADTRSGIGQRRWRASRP